MDNLRALWGNSSSNKDVIDTENITVIAPTIDKTQTNGEIAVLMLISLILTLLIFSTIIGNVSVIAAVLIERNLQTVGNGLVLSLAIADLMVACLVMPIGAVYEVLQEWTLGPELCEIWTSCDVLCCTASILHLLAIAIDRFWAVTNIDYIRKRNRCHIGLMIISIWVVAFIISFAPVFGWKDPAFQYRVEVEKVCLVSQDVAYQLFATCATFYIPLVVILFLYWRIYLVARKRIRHKPGEIKRSSHFAFITTLPPSTLSELSVVSNNYSSHPSSDNSINTSKPVEIDITLKPIIYKKTIKAKKETLNTKRERKAAKTLAIITSVFVICWLPFFVIALILPLCKTCEPKDYVFSIFLWLGYANSMINPIIYTIFSPDFRAAFQNMLCCKSLLSRM